MLTFLYFLVSPLIDLSPTDQMQYFLSIALPTLVMVAILVRVGLNGFWLEKKRIRIERAEMWFLLFFLYMMLAGLVLSIPLMGKHILGETGIVKSIKQSLMIGLAVGFYITTYRVSFWSKGSWIARALAWPLGFLLVYGFLEYLKYGLGISGALPFEAVFHPLIPDSYYGLQSRLRLTAPEPSMAAPYLVIFSSILLYLFWRGVKRWVYPVLVLLAFLLLLVLGSKGALISVVLALVFTSIFGGWVSPHRRHRLRFLLGGLALTLLIGGVGLFSKTGRELLALQVYENTVLTRVLEMLVGLKIFVERPFFGIGAGNLVFYFNTYLNKVGIISEELFWVLFAQTTDRAIGYKNMYISVLAEGGLVGGILFGLFLYQILKTLKRATRRTPHALILVFLFFFILMTMLYTDGYNRIYWWLGLGLIKGLGDHIQWEVSHRAA